MKGRERKKDKKEIILYISIYIYIEREREIVTKIDVEGKTRNTEKVSLCVIVN